MRKTAALPTKPMLFTDWLEPMDIRRTFSCTACIICSVGQRSKQI